jgi:hypothetical protein
MVTHNIRLDQQLIEKVERQAEELEPYGFG